MAELGAAASVIGIATAAIQSIQFLCKTVDNIKGVPDAIHNIKDDLQSMEPVLSTLKAACESDGTQIVLSSEVRTAAANCDKSCKAFQATVEHWMRHSSADKAFWLDRWRVGLFGQERIKAFKGQLNDYKSTLTVALSTGTIITTTRQQGIMQEMKDMMLKQQETVLQTELTRAQDQDKGIETALQQLSLDTTSGLDQELVQSREDLMNQLRQQQAANESLRHMCEELVSKTVEERTGQKIKGVKATGDSTAVAGFINTDGEERSVRLDISDVTADNRSFAGAGVIKNLNFKDLHRGG